MAEVSYNQQGTLKQLVVDWVSWDGLRDAYTWRECEDLERDSTTHLPTIKI